MKAAIISTLQNQAGTMLSGMIDKVGLTSIAGFVGIKASEEAGVIQLAETMSESWSMADYALLTTIIGTVTFIVKNVMETRKAYLEAKIHSKKLKGKE